MATCARILFSKVIFVRGIYDNGCSACVERRVRDTKQVFPNKRWKLIDSPERTIYLKRQNKYVRGSRFFLTKRKVYVYTYTRFLFAVGMMRYFLRDKYTGKETFNAFCPV